LFVTVIDKNEDIDGSGLAGKIVGWAVLLHKLLQGVSFQVCKPADILTGIAIVDIMLLLFFEDPFF
jgi:hypothetical protein